jgi:hypothetical protein
VPLGRGARDHEIVLVRERPPDVAEGAEASDAEAEVAIVVRIAHLGDIAEAKGQPFAYYDLAAAAVRERLDRGALWNQFIWELGILLVPVARPSSSASALAAGAGRSGLGRLATIPIRYPSGAGRR